MPKLNVNIDHIATLRQARLGNEPDPVFAAYLSELAGAEGIVAHLREDRRHIQDRDIYLLKNSVKTKLNLEMAPTKEMVQITKEVKPDMVTLVPEKRQELTTEGGLNVKKNIKTVESVVSELKKSEIFVSLFIDPNSDQIAASKELEADMVEIHTGGYADSRDDKQRNRELEKIINAVNYALDSDMRVAAGHGLDYRNTKRISEIEGIEELNIGYSIICRSVIIGMERAVKEMLMLCGN